MVRNRRANWIHYKKAFLFRSKQEDIEVLKSMFELGKYCAISPINAQHFKHMPTVSKVFWAILFFIHFITTFRSIIPDGLLVYDLLAYIWILSMLLFVGSIVLRSNFTTRNNWLSFFDYMNRMEQVLERMEFQTSQKKSKLWTEMSFILAIFLLWFILTVYDETNDWYFYCALNIYNFYSSVFLLYIRMHCRVMRNRYDFVTEKLKKFVEDEDNKQTSFKAITTFLKLADKSVCEGNIIFGWPLFFYTINGIDFILLNFIFLLFSTNDWLSISATVFVISTYVISLVSMVSSCDSLGKSVDKVTKTCYKLHLRSNDGKIKKKLLQIAKYSQQMKPAFTAAGFFDINRFVLTEMFSTFINYSVALIQFHMLMK